MSSEIEIGFPVSSPFRQSRIEENPNEETSNGISSASSIDVDVNRKTWDLIKRSSYYNRVILALNSFSDVISSVYSFLFALVVTISFSKMNGGYLIYNYDLYEDDNPTYFVSPLVAVPTASPTPKPSSVHYKTDYRLTAEAKFFLLIWVVTEGINMVVLISFRLYANLCYSRITGDPTLALRRLAVVKIASMLHYCLVVCGTAGFCATMASYSYMQEQISSNVAYYEIADLDDYQGFYYDCRLLFDWRTSGVFIPCTLTYKLVQVLQVLVILFLFIGSLTMIEYFFKPLVNYEDGVCAWPMAVYIYIYLMPFYVLSVVLMPFMYILLQLLVVLCPDKQLKTALKYYRYVVLYPCYCDSLPFELKKQVLSVGVITVSGLTTFLLGFSCAFFSFKLFSAIQPLTLQRACAPFTPTALVLLWIFSKVVQVAVMMIIPLVRMTFAKKIRRLRNLVYIFLVVEIVQDIIESMFDILRLRGAQQELQQSGEELIELQEAREKVAMLRATLMTEINDLSSILFDTPLGEQM